MTAPSARDPTTRFHSGFDRWDFDALADRRICCNHSNCIEHQMDCRGAIWFWSREDQVWWQMGPDQEAQARAQNALYVAELRRAVPIIRLYVGTSLGGEREAAYAALSRLADKVEKAFRTAPTDGGAAISAADLYSGATQSERWQVVDLDPPPHDWEIWEELYRRDSLRKAARAA
jgi:hypothetical protein